MMNLSYTLATMLFMTVSSCGTKTVKSVDQDNHSIASVDTTGMEKAYFASGCFWCVEAIFESVEGVGEVISGYAGGSAETATYEQVSSGMSKHAEAVEIFYDPKKINYSTLLTVFFDSHDPATLNRQGPDYGFQYRSAIFYSSDEERKLAQAMIDKLSLEHKFKAPITTIVEPLDAFYPAEAYHQNFERRNPTQGYVMAVSVPRLKKFLALHPELLKKSTHK
jgi:peptide-methionine (S)-S-oxide reductase